MPANQYTINPETGRQIRIGGAVFCRLIFNYYDFINGALVRRNTAPPIQPRDYFYNTVTNRRILANSRRYHELVNLGWEFEDDNLMVPPNSNTAPESDYERIMATYQEQLTNLNITLCRECLTAINLEDGEYCNTCKK